MLPEKGVLSPDARGGLLLFFACFAPNGKKVEWERVI